MKYQILLVLALFMANACKAPFYPMNQGGTSQKNYFSVVKFESFHGFMIVTAKIKGDDYKFMLDTGAPNCVSKALQKKLNFKVLNKFSIGDSNGNKDSMTAVIVDAIEFGGVTFNAVPTLVMDSPLFIDCMKVDGLIGSNMLKNSIVRFSYTDRTITLTDDIEKLNISEKYASDMVVTSGQSSPLIRVKLEGKGKNPEQLLFDTGFNGFYDFADRHYKTFENRDVFSVEAEGYGRSSVGIHGNSKDVSCKKLNVHEMNVNGTAFQNISTETSTDPNSKIGHKILEFGNATLDYKNKKFYFEPFKEKVDMKEKTFPFRARINDDKLFIGIVWDDKLKENVEIGDQIIAIDGVNCEQVSICNAASGKLFAGKDTAKLTIKDKNGLIKDIVIEKK
jgi:predicted aspartyl protease